MGMITARVDDEIKESASKLAEKLGMNLTTVINIFLRKFIAEKGIKIALDDTDPAYYESDEFIDVDEPAEIVTEYLSQLIAKDEQKAKKISKKTNS